LKVSPVLLDLRGRIIKKPGKTAQTCRVTSDHHVAKRKCNSVVIFTSERCSIQVHRPFRCRAEAGELFA